MNRPIRIPSGRPRVLILDFDFYTAVGGGQVFYRRVVERNSSVDFYYPSAGADCDLKSTGKLPENAHPFIFDGRAAFDALWPEHEWLRRRTACVAAAVQGMTFHAVDVPSFFPAAHVVREVMTAFGITVEKVAVGLVGWLSVSLKNGYENVDPGTIAGLEEAETASVEAADVRYTISIAEQADQAKTSLAVTLLDMHDAIEAFPTPEPEPPGSGPPDVWYVGRLDGAKGPDLFLRLVAQMPRELYGRCFFTGPDNPWSTGKRWSQELLELARSLHIDARYEGLLSDAEIRSRVYRGRTVLVVPSRNDAFNYVALEGVLNACPVLLSERTGAFGFLRDIHPRLLPETMIPEELGKAADKLRNILRSYDEVARQKRRELIDKPFPAPREGFMKAVYCATSVHSPERRKKVGDETIALRKELPLLLPALKAWRPARRASAQPRVSVVIPTFDRPELLAPTLSCLTRQTLEDIEVIVVDDGSPDAIRVRRSAEAFAPMVRLIRTANAGEALAVNTGIEAARGEFVGFLSDDDVYAPELLAESVTALERDPNAIGTYPDWDIIDTAGYHYEPHVVPEFDRSLMLSAHWCLPGPGAVIRREILGRIGGRDVSFRYVSDFDLWLRATRHGPMIRIPRKLAYWRLHASNLTGSSRRLQMAQERIAVLEKLFREPDEPADDDLRRKAYAAAHVSAAAILGPAEPSEARKHLRAAAKLWPGLFDNLPPNLEEHRAAWPAFLPDAED